jgi:hypothetical protein
VWYEGLKASAPFWVEITKITKGLQRAQIATRLHFVASQQLNVLGIPIQPFKPIALLQVCTLILSF